MSFKIINYEIELTVRTGLYIGAGDSGMRIGGIDNNFIRNPRTNEPYIPGSSIKGKMRSLLEYDAGILEIRAKEKPQQENDKNINKQSSQKDSSGNLLGISDIEKVKETDRKEYIKNLLRLFGVMPDKKSSIIKEIGITRLSVADFMLLKDEKDSFAEIFEIKPETAIDRSNGTAKQGSLRFTERVVAGTKFKGSISLKVMNDNEREELENILLKGLRYIELDALGGSSSRGYGRVDIKFLGEHDNLNKRLKTIIPNNE